MVNWKASASATLVGSMPHRDRERAIDLILENMTDIPVWPQLPSFRNEEMMFQYNEGLPGLRISDDQVFVETNSADFENELYAFYEEYLQVETDDEALDASRFTLGEETGKTFFRFLEKLEKFSGAFRAVKGQVVGPFTLLTDLKDQDKRALVYDERLQEVIAKHLAMKAKWQVQRLSSFDRPVIIFLDEPALAGFGSSAFVGVSAELVRHLLTEVMNAVHDAGGLAGVHVCANTDWGVVFESPADIVNFDAYSYFDKFALYEEQLAKFIKEGRTVAWGIVPTSDPEALRRESAQSLADQWLQRIESLTDPELSKEALLSQALFTPSCGCGTLSEGDAERVVYLTRELGEIMQNA